MTKAPANRASEHSTRTACSPSSCQQSTHNSNHDRAVEGSRTVLRRAHQHHCAHSGTRPCAHTLLFMMTAIVTMLTGSRSNDVTVDRYIVGTTVALTVEMLQWRHARHSHLKPPSARSRGTQPPEPVLLCAWAYVAAWVKMCLQVACERTRMSVRECKWVCAPRRHNSWTLSRTGHGGRLRTLESTLHTRPRTP